MNNTKTDFCPVEICVSIQNCALNHLGFTPTNDQSSALASLAKFVARVSDHRVFILQGFAGTGKTSVISAIVRAMEDHEINFCLLSPTGKAASVMTRYSGFPACTIHHEIYEFVEQNRNQVRFRLKSGIRDRLIFIVDESSMISDLPPSPDADCIFGKHGLLHDLITYCLGSSNNRIIIIGDPAQLPPVGSNTSPALDADYFTNRYELGAECATLRDIVRQREDSGIRQLALSIRDRIATQNHFVPILVPEHDDTLWIPESQFEKSYKRSLADLGSTGITVLAHQNRTVTARNHQIRERILSYREKLNLSEPLTVTRNNYAWSIPDQLLYLANGEIVRPLEIGPERRLGRFHFTEAVVGACSARGDPLQLNGLLMLNPLQPPFPAINNRDMGELFCLALERYPDLDRRRGEIAVRSDPHYVSLVTRYAYAITVHRAQGSQWENVFLDLSDWRWFYRTNPSTALHWLYTAVTRATRRLIFIGMDPSRAIPVN